jgi:hypothetical protein
MLQDKNLQYKIFQFVFTKNRKSKHICFLLLPVPTQDGLKRTTQ